MNPDKEHIIPINRKKILSSIRTNIFLILFFGFMFWLFMTNPPKENATVLQLGAISLVLLLAFTLIFNLRKLKDKSPGLVINSKGIIENSSFFPVGFIHWHDVARTYIQQARSTRWLMIEVQNPEQYFSKDNMLIRTLQRLNSTFGGSAIFISANHLDVGFDEMVKIINEYCDKYSSA